jgi:hypothetical protein
MQCEDGTGKMTTPWSEEEEEEDPSVDGMLEIF